MSLLETLIQRQVKKLFHYKKYNQTVIVITHDEKIALEADRIITIDDGKIIKDERNGK